MPGALPAGASRCLSCCQRTRCSCPRRYSTPAWSGHRTWVSYGSFPRELPGVSCGAGESGAGIAFAACFAQRVFSTLRTCCSRGPPLRTARFSGAHQHWRESSAPGCARPTSREPFPRFLGTLPENQIRDLDFRGNGCHGTEREGSGTSRRVEPPTPTT